MRFRTIALLCLLGVMLALALPLTGQGADQAATAPERSPAAAQTPAPPPASTNQIDVVTFGLDGIQVLQENRVLGEPLWKYAASLIYALLAIVTALAIDWLVSNRLKQWASKTETKIDDLLLDVVHGPVKVISFVIFLHIGLRIFAWPKWAGDYLSKGLQLVVAWSLTYMALKMVDMLMVYWRQRVGAVDDKSIDDQLIPLVRKSIKAFIILVAVLVTSQNLGLNITSVLASLSIGGLALGLAAQDTIANLFGAVSIFIDKPFRIGDRVKLDGVDGMVESIGLRSTRIRNLDGFLITVPNKTMGGATITNVSRRPTIKTEMTVGLVYDTPAERVRRAAAILEDIYRGNRMTADLIVSFSEFGDSSLNIKVIHWWNGTDYKAYMAGMQELNLAVMQRFAAERLDMAYPTQTLYVRQDSDWRFSGGQHPTKS